MSDDDLLHDMVHKELPESRPAKSVKVPAPSPLSAGPGDAAARERNAAVRALAMRIVTMDVFDHRAAVETMRAIARAIAEKANE